MGSALAAVYDACVLYPAPLRDLLLRLGASGLFRARWTDRINEEWRCSLQHNDHTGLDYRSCAKRLLGVDCGIECDLIPQHAQDADPAQFF